MKHPLKSTASIGMICAALLLLMLACNFPILSEEGELESAEQTQSVETLNMPAAQRTQDVASLSQLSGERIYKYLHSRQRAS